MLHSLEYQTEGGFLGFLKMIEHLVGGFRPVSLKAGADNGEVFFEGVLETVVGNVSGHVAEAFSLGSDQVVIVPYIYIGAGVYNYLMEIGIQLIEIVVIPEAFAVGIIVRKDLIKLVQPIHGKHGAIVEQNVGLIHGTDFKKHIDIVYRQWGNGDAALGHNLDQSFLFKAA